MGIKFNALDFITVMIKLVITSILSTQAAIDPSWAAFIGNTATELLGSLSFEKKQTIKDSIDKIPEQIMPVINQFTMPDECKENLAYSLFNFDNLKECVKSENIVETFKALIIDICKDCPDCDIETLQTVEIANAVSEKVIALFFEDKNLSDIANLFTNRAAYEVVLENNKELKEANNKLNIISEHLIASDNSSYQESSAYKHHKQKISWITSLPYVPVTKHHIAREDEDKMVQSILDSDCTKIAISGVVGGIGKTELLQIVCKSVLDMYQYHYVGWIYYSGDLNSDVLDSLSPQFVTNHDPIGSLFALDFQYGQDMIIFIDNADSNNDDEYLKFISRLTCTVIVTTRNQSFFDFKMASLDLLSEDVASKIYLTYSDQSDMKTDIYIKQIVKLCGYHPLAIELVGKYAKKRKLSSKSVYSELLKNGYNLNGLVDSNWNGNRNELIVTQLSKLYKLSTLSLDIYTVYILKCFTIIPSKPIIKLFVDSIADGKNADYASFDMLVDNGWISSVQSGWYMHDVVKSVIKSELDIVIDDCADFLQNLCKYSTNLVNYPVMISSLMLLTGVAEFFYNSNMKSNDLLIKIYNDIGYVYQEITDYRNAKRWFERAFDAINFAEQNYKTIFIQGIISNNIGLVSQQIIERKKNQHEEIPDQEIKAVTAWYDKSLSSYEKLLQEDIYDRIHIERRKLIVENNKASWLYQEGYKREAIDSLNKIIYKKLQIIDQFITILYYYYTRLLKDNLHSKISSIVDGYNSLKTIDSIIHKFYTPKNEINNRRFINDNSISDTLNLLDNYRFVFDNELIPSLVRSCDAYADFQCDYVMTARDADEVISRLTAASATINFALDVCETIDKITTFEGAAWGTLSRVHFTWQLMFTNVNSKEAAINEQLQGIQILESIFRESSEWQSKDPLFRAYNNMYIYTGEEAWKKKADQLLIQPTN